MATARRAAPKAPFRLRNCAKTGSPAVGPSRAQASAAWLKKLMSNHVPTRIQPTVTSGAGPNSSLRAELVPQYNPAAQQPKQLELFEPNHHDEQSYEPSNLPKTAARIPWASLLKRVFKLDVTVCPQCKGSLRIVEIVNDPDTIAKRLAQAGLGPMPPPKAPPRVPGQLALAFD